MKIVSNLTKFRRLTTQCANTLFKSVYEGHYFSRSKLGQRHFPFIEKKYDKLPFFLKEPIDSPLQVLEHKPLDLNELIQSTVLKPEVTSKPLRRSKECRKEFKNLISKEFQESLKPALNAIVTKFQAGESVHESGQAQQEDVLLKDFAGSIMTTSKAHHYTHVMTSNTIEHLGSLGRLDMCRFVFNEYKEFCDATHVALAKAPFDAIINVCSIEARLDIADEYLQIMENSNVLIDSKTLNPLVDACTVDNLDYALFLYYNFLQENPSKFARNKLIELCLKSTDGQQQHLLNILNSRSISQSTAQLVIEQAQSMDALQAVFNDLLSAKGALNGKCAQISLISRIQYLMSTTQSTTQSILMTQIAFLNKIHNAKIMIHPVTLYYLLSKTGELTFILGHLERSIFESSRDDCLVFTPNDDSYTSNDEPCTLNDKPLTAPLPMFDAIMRNALKGLDSKDTRSFSRIVQLVNHNIHLLSSDFCTDFMSFLAKARLDLAFEHIYFKALEERGISSYIPQPLHGHEDQLLPICDGFTSKVDLESPKFQDILIKHFTKFHSLGIFMDLLQISGGKPSIKSLFKTIDGRQLHDADFVSHVDRKIQHLMHHLTLHSQALSANELKSMTQSMSQILVRYHTHKVSWLYNTRRIQETRKQDIKRLAHLYTEKFKEIQDLLTSGSDVFQGLAHLESLQVKEETLDENRQEEEEEPLRESASVSA